MTISLNKVRQLLLPEEPDYATAARLGAGLLPHLRTLINQPDKMLASKAAYLATLIDDDRTVEVLRDAAKSASAAVRVAAAGGLHNLKRPGAAALLMALLNDRDAGVRKLAIKSSATRDNSALLAKIGNLSRNDPSPMLRSLAAQVVSRSRGGA